MSAKAKKPNPETVKLWNKINPLNVNQLISELNDPVKGRNHDKCNRCGFSFELDELFNAGDEGYLCEDCLKEREEEGELEMMTNEEKKSKAL